MPLRDQQLRVGVKPRPFSLKLAQSFGLSRTSGRCLDFLPHPLLRAFDGSEEGVIGGHAVSRRNQLQSARLLTRSKFDEPEAQVFPDGVAEIVKACARSRLVEVDDPDRQSLAPDQVPGAEVVVADDFTASGDFNPSSGVVESAQ